MDADYKPHFVSFRIGGSETRFLMLFADSKETALANAVNYLRSLKENTDGSERTAEIVDDPTTIVLAPTPHDPSKYMLQRMPEDLGREAAETQQKQEHMLKQGTVDLGHKSKTGL